MSEAGWGTEKPTVAGWYWWRFLATKDGEWIMHPIKVIQLPNGSFYSSRLGDMTTKTFGEFLGPITPHAYAAGRRAGLEQALKVAERFPWHRGPAHANASIHQGRREGEKAASESIANEIGRMILQIEAQAQGGSVRCQRCGGSGYTQSDDPARPLSRCGTCQGDGRYQPPQAKGGEHGKG